jgi:hypothetical protein
MMALNHSPANGMANKTAMTTNRDMNASYHDGEQNG